MAIPYEKIVEEDLDLGTGTVTRTMPGGGTATGHQISLSTFLGSGTIGLSRFANHFYDFVIDFGGVGDGVTDNAAAFAAAFAALSANALGGTLWIGRGTFKTSAVVALVGKTDIILQGGGEILYSGTGSVWLTLQDCQRIRVQDLRISYSNAAFTGTLIKAAFVTTNPAYLWFDNLVFLGTGGAIGAAAGLDFSGAIICDVRRCRFGSMNIGVRFTGTNVLTIANCTFIDLTSWGIECYGGSQSILVQNCTFERLANLRSGAFHQVTTSVFFIWGLNIDSNWFGDVGANGGSWISLLVVLGCSIRGNFFGTPGAGATDVCVRLAASTGVNIGGNRFEGPHNLSFEGTNSVGVILAGNDFQAGAPLLTSNVSGLAAIANFGLANAYPA